MTDEALPHLEIEGQLESTQQPFEPEDQAGEGDAVALEYMRARQEHLNMMITRALTGELGRHRPLKYWENLRLRPIHLQIIMMRAAGFKIKAIASAVELSDVRVRQVCNHPDALTLISLLVSHAAEDLLDIKTRIKAHAGEALDTVVQVMRNSKNDGLRSQNAFKLLEMAGYGAVEKKEVEHSLKMEKEVGERLFGALAEASDYEEHSPIQFIEQPATMLPGESGIGESLTDGSTPADGSAPPTAEAPSQHVA